MKPTLILGALLALFLGIGVAATAGKDRTRVASTLEDAYFVRDAGASVVLGLYSHSFETAGPAAVGVLSDQPTTKFAIGEMVIAEAQAQQRKPKLFGKDQARIALRESRAWTHLLATPRGAWLTYQTDLAAVRRSLDSAIADLEDHAGRDAAGTAKSRAAARVAKLEGEVDAITTKSAEDVVRKEMEAPGKALDATFDTPADREARAKAENERRLEEARKAFEAGQK